MARKSTYFPDDNIVMKKIFIIKAGTTFSNTKQRFGDFDDWTITVLGASKIPIEVIDVKGNFQLPDIHACAGVIVTGSHTMVTERERWSQELEEWIPLIIDHLVPYFGICYGHQLLAQALGGWVGYHPEGEEVGTVTITKLSSAEDDPIFKKLPKSFKGHAVHAQSVLKLPPWATCLAKNAFEPHHAFRVGHCAWGVQFHPEYTPPVMKDYVKEAMKKSEDPEKLESNILSEVSDTPDAMSTLKYFIKYIEENTISF